MSRAVRSAVAAVCGGLLLSGCSMSFSVGPQVGKDALEKTVTERLTEMAGQRPDSVTCPGPLAAEVGKTERCVLTAGGDRIGVTVTVTSVQGGNVKFDIEVDDQPMP
ncbi:DUF4333 domain-containing protein [Saccharopolyspora hordei]|mgnify:CR=1 FL=1|uniref:DUF4333 domain-containing protein n=1 Tax=Saccharopolyspora hordei TaxID=1838 RepID=A0A853AEF9_9PSEU|nr:DUF4333 domain-containing protein [Saccharopolyspora hordei]NYI81479.1 hypothetical protein [Saccharopolyspora hordei]